MGQSEKVLGQYQEALGQSGKILGQYQEVLGQSGKVLGQNQEVLGQRGKVLVQYQEVLGQSGKVLGQYQEVLGHSRKVLGQYRKDFSVPKSLGTAPRSLGTVQKSLGTLLQSLGTVPKGLGTVPRSLGTLLKGKTFGMVSAVATEDNRGDDRGDLDATASHEATVENGTTTNQEKTPLLEVSDLMAKLEQIDKKLKCSEKDREVIKKEIRYNKNEYLDNYFNLASATEEKLQQMSDKVEATDKDREKNIKKDMQVMKQRYDTVNSKLGSLETRMDTMRRDQAESSCAIQAKT